MHRLICVLLLAGACLAAQPSEEAVKKELKLFQGKWEAVAAQGFDGKAPTAVELQLTMLIIEGEKFTMKTGSLDIKATFTVDPTKKPKHIDVFFGDGKDNVMRGIYEIKGDMRKSCFAEPGKDRPDKFRKEKGFMTMEWRQAK
ncbi:MAG: TIGR03067 domain-containing protein [Gemmataceae bacterium]|nr:TIGR03067 domain-containing protein [Gemmataceae bacterium]